jgi:hypothetical protein
VTRRPREGRAEVKAHVIELDLWATRNVRGGPEDDKRWVRWRCSCHLLGPPLLRGHVTWQGRTTAERRARTGGASHVAAMERGKR